LVSFLWVANKSFATPKRAIALMGLATNLLGKCDILKSADETDVKIGKKSQDQMQGLCRSNHSGLEYEITLVKTTKHALVLESSGKVGSVIQGFPLSGVAAHGSR
jgi:hypothetical protein